MTEDIQFLKELQQELLTQEDDCQAAPRFWTVGDYKKVPCPDDFHDEYHINLPNTEHWGEINELLKQIKEDEFDDLSEDAKEEFNEISCEVTAINWFKTYYDEGAELIPVREEHFIHPNTMFLTKAEAKKHIELNYYHYSPRAHTYAMTAWRAPKVERLLKILETFDFDKFEQYEAEINRLKYWEEDGKREIAYYRNMAKSIEQEKERYKKALEFYARKLNYSQSTVDQDIPIVNKDNGQIARNVLEG